MNLEGIAPTERKSPEQGDGAKKAGDEFKPSGSSSAYFSYAKHQVNYQHKHQKNCAPSGYFSAVPAILWFDSENSCFGAVAVVHKILKILA